MKVVGIAPDVDRIQDLAVELRGSKGELHAVQGDVTKEEDVVRVVKWTRDNLGGADVLVNNAGVVFKFPLTDADTSKMHKVYDVNVLGLCVFTREVLQDMRERRIDDGHIFNIGSVHGHNMFDRPGYALYSSSKHVVRVITEGLRRELRDLKSNLKVTEISPGLTRTELTQASGMSEEETQQLYASRPHLQPQDVADALIYALATPPHVQVHEIVMFPV